MPNLRFYDNMIFNYETINRTDFQNEEIDNVPRTKYQAKPPRPRTPYVPLKDIHTLTEFKTRNLPTEMFVKPKDIVRSDPAKVQEPFVEAIDEDRAKAQATRPRLVMTPALSFDDIEDPKVRDLLIKDVYSSSMKSAQIKVQPSFTCVRAPLPGHYAPANPITLPKLQVPLVSPEWRMDSVTWDNRQLRGYCDPDKHFYLTRTPRCDVCDHTALRKLQKKRQRF